MGVLAILILGLLALSASPLARAQSMPPASATPVDAFHQPCVAVRAMPNAPIPDKRPATTTAMSAMPATFTGQPVQKWHVDLDNRCATPPAFAPTRDVDSTSIWYVDAPERNPGMSQRHPGALTLHGVTS
ncbi:hypothetical protein DBA20_18260 [Pandoraea capi]|nr:hypothetical protein [Pandoraea sp. LA3]MDN4584922.1 hypothetical protein [Pandoraea capi]